jgi:hypothetical protein
MKRFGRWRLLAALLGLIGLIVGFEVHAGHTRSSNLANRVTVRPLVGSISSPEGAGTPPAEAHGPTRIRAPGVEPSSVASVGPTTGFGASPCQSCPGTTNSVGANQWFENLSAQGTASFTTTTGTSSLKLPDKFSISWQSADQELHIVSTDKYIIGLFIRTNDASCDVIRAIYLTLPDGKGRITTTYPLLMGQPLSWMTLQPGTTASGTADNDRFLIRVQRPGQSSWVISATINPHGPGGEPWLSDANFSISTSSFRPPWQHFELRAAAHSPSGSFQAQGQFSRQN